jgi:hypothetical protein
MVTFYTKDAESDFDFDPTRMDEKDDLGIYLQQIKNIFTAEAWSIMGAADMPIDLEQYIYSTSISEYDLKKVVLDSIYKYCTFNSKFSTNLSVKFSKGEMRDICIIDIFIDGQKKMSLMIK